MSFVCVKEWNKIRKWCCWYRSKNEKVYITLPNRQFSSCATKCSRQNIFVCLYYAKVSLIYKRNKATQWKRENITGKHTTQNSSERLKFGKCLREKKKMKTCFVINVPKYGSQIYKKFRPPTQTSKHEYWCNEVSTTQAAAPTQCSISLFLTLTQCLTLCTPTFTHTLTIHLNAIIKKDSWLRLQNMAA